MLMARDVLQVLHSGKSRNCQLHVPPLKSRERNVNKILQIWHMAEQLQRLEVAQQLRTTGKNIILNIMRLLCTWAPCTPGWVYWRCTLRTGEEGTASAPEWICWRWGASQGGMGMVFVVWTRLRCIPIVPPGGNPMVFILLQSYSPFTGLMSHKMVKTEHEGLQRLHCHHGTPGYRSVLACLMCPLTQGWALPGSTGAAGEAPAQGRTCASRGDTSDRTRAVTQKFIQKSQTTLAVQLILYRHQEKGLCLTCPQ